MWYPNVEYSALADLLRYTLLLHFFFLENMPKKNVNEHVWKKMCKLQLNLSLAKNGLSNSYQALLCSPFDII